MTDLKQLTPRKKQRRAGRGLLAAVSAVAVAGVFAIAPVSGLNYASAEVIPLAPGETLNQELMAAATAQVEFELPPLEIAEIPKPEPEPKAVTTSDAASGGGAAPAFAPPAPAVSPGSAQEIARGYVANDQEFACLVSLWQRESNWNPSAMNASSGAYGIPQALPGEKMASAGADWRTNPDTQIRWGLGYIVARYGSPCGAWGHSESVGWY
ncbi:transglycosylase SLT domain-containing protein [Canibacter zhoujuaniae]|uniref:aggregation-promoting factor C-terminal-like domain-containing protein n=1 Tax=Canibacter zhoujuaniae TaxID=2708343 RepID=UPI001FB8EE06|nr:transglycosylase SLT domain-containing protein [Canibacter zhoujuaniae]